MSKNDFLPSLARERSEGGETEEEANQVPWVFLSPTMSQVCFWASGFPTIFQYPLLLEHYLPWSSQTKSWLPYSWLTVRNLPKAPAATSFLTWEELITEASLPAKLTHVCWTPFLEWSPPSSNCLLFAFYMRRHETLGGTQVREQLISDLEPSHLQAKGVLCVFDTSCPFPARDKRQHEWEAMNRLLFHTEHLQSLVLHEKIKTNKQKTAKSLAKVKNKKTKKQKDFPLHL